MLTNRLLITSPNTALTARNIANPLDGLSSPYKKTKIPTLTTLYLLTLYILTEALSSI